MLRKLQELKKSVIKETYGEKYVENPKNEEVQETIDKEKECNEIKYENLEKDSDLEIKEDEKEYVAEEKVQEEKAPEKKQETNEDIIEETKGYEIQSEKEDTKFSPEFEEMYMKMFGTKPSEEQSSKQDGVANEEINDIMKNVDNISIFDRFPETQKTNYKFIGIAFEGYVILEINQEMYILNVRKAKERILYEIIKENYYSKEKANSQLLLLPDVITLTKKDMEIAKDNIEMLKKSGFIFEQFGEDTIKLTEVPEICIDMETKELFLEILKEINSVARTAKKEIEEKFLKTISKKVVENEYKIITKEDAQGVIEKLLTLSNPFESSKGDSIAIKMSKYDIERKFSRK